MKVWIGVGLAMVFGRKVLAWIFGAFPSISFGPSFREKKIVTSNFDNLDQNNSNYIFGHFYYYRHQSIQFS